MKKKAPSHSPRLSLNDLIEQITVDAEDEGEQVWAFQQAFRDNIAVPCEGFVIGEPVTVVKFDFDGNERRGLTAKCRRADGSVYVVSAAEVTLPHGVPGSRYIDAYRRWMGVAPRKAPRRAELVDTAKGAVDSLELVVLSIKKLAARCRTPRSTEGITLRARGFWDLVPGEIVSVRPNKQWTYGGNPYISGEIQSKRIDAAALGLEPLRLEQRGVWNPKEQYWGEKGEPIEKWAKPIIARGVRQAFEMEQVLPGMDPEDPWSDPITESNERKDAGDAEGAYKILMGLCQADLRCLDAHAHLGNLIFDRRPEDASRHYEVGFRIGELSLGENFGDVLDWGWLDNRPFLRCMQGFGICLWRLGDFKGAYAIFERMLWMNPGDNQGVRFLIDDVRAKRSWQDSQSE